MTTDRAVIVLKMMANPIRLRILKVLAEKENGICVGKMGELLNIPQPSISQHLAHLRNCEIIKFTKVGKNVCYEITEDSIRKMIKSLEMEDFDIVKADCNEGG